MNDDTAFMVKTICGAMAFVAVVIILVVLAVNAAVGPVPHCPDGYTLAGGGYGGRYHCIVGVDPIR